jgi:methyltransferase family protein
MLTRMLDAATTRLVRWFGLGYDTFALVALQNFALGYVPWSQSSIRPSALICLLNDIKVNRRRTIVEFGGGVSTMFVAELIRDGDDQRLLSFEHDEAWSRWLNEWLERRGLAGVARCVHAPLRPCPGYDLSWYDLEIVRGALPELPVDCLLCDGPPAWAGGSAMARLPAVPVVRDYLAGDFSIILDDIQRHHERRIAKVWQRMLGVRFQRVFLRGGFALAINGRHNHPLI